MNVTGGSEAMHERRQGERRKRGGRRSSDRALAQWLEPAWADQVVQFLTRYVFVALGAVYFNYVFPYTSSWLTQVQLNLFFAIYAAWVTVMFVHAGRKPYSVGRFRAAMWVDVASVSVAVLHDPFAVPLSAMVYIVIALGNGMRYGMRAFSEALFASFMGCLAALTLRYTESLEQLTPGVLFLMLFAALILVYAYILMGRVDASRRSLERSSKMDPLTGLMHRGALLDVARPLFASARAGETQLVVMFADLDKFKGINDTHGHAQGDRVLCEVGRILRSGIREQDVAARYGGDEFVIVLKDASLDQAEHIAQRVQQALHYWAAEQGIDVSMTIGMGAAPAHGSEFMTLLNNVDQALYRSKQEHGPGGLGCVGPAQSHPEVAA